jgi:DNA repair exonuclease SbcCD ATPase subunit
VVDDLTRRVEALVGEQSARSVELASAQEALRAHVERLETDVRELPAPAETPDLEPLVSDLTRRVEVLASEQSARATEIAGTHETLRSAIERVEAELRELPEPQSPVPPSEDEQLRHLLTAFADRIDAMEHERATIAEEAAQTALSTVDQVRPLVEGLRRRLDESDRRLEALGPTDELNAKLDELATRMQTMEERPATSPQPSALPGDGRFRVELRALELRMQHAEAAARENREAVLVQLERLASRIEWRLQKLETDEPAEPEGSQEEPSLGQVVPLRGGAETT